jgi:uncharacterized membrane protein
LDVVYLKNKIIHIPSSQRFIEIDMLRGVAIILMIFSHIFWDLDYFGLMPINSGIYSILQSTVTPTFFLLVGLSLVVSKKKTETMTLRNEKKYYRRLIFRGLKIYGLGMILTILTLLLIPEKPVLFGVLHCIGLSVILSAPFLKYRRYNLLFAFIILFASLVVAGYHIENPTIFHLAVGLHQTNVWSYTVDYFPLLPWFGICLFGIVIGDCLYSGNERKFKMPDLSRYRPAKIFQWCGQHSLMIYLLHQPIIAGALSIFMILH